MKRLEISRLMDEYTDNEFFPQGGEAADAQAVKERVLAQAAPAKKRRRPLKMALLAAAMAVGCVLCIAAGVPGMAYRILSGTVTLETSEDGLKYVNLQLDAEPVEVEDGRIFFVQDGQRTDITDLIDMETPYIYDDSNPDAGTLHYLIIGGTPNCYGWLEWFEGPQPQNWQEDQRVIDAGLTDAAFAAYSTKMVSVSPRRESSKTGSGVCYFGFARDMQYRWLENALDTLGILMEQPDPDEASTRLRSGIFFYDLT